MPRATEALIEGSPNPGIMTSAMYGHLAMTTGVHPHGSRYASTSKEDMESVWSTHICGSRSTSHTSSVSTGNPCGKSSPFNW